MNLPVNGRNRKNKEKFYKFQTRIITYLRKTMFQNQLQGVYVFIIKKVLGTILFLPRVDCPVSIRTGTADYKY